MTNPNAYTKACTDHDGSINNPFDVKLALIKSTSDYEEYKRRVLEDEMDNMIYEIIEKAEKAKKEKKKKEEAEKIASAALLAAGGTAGGGGGAEAVLAVEAAAAHPTDAAARSVVVAQHLQHEEENKEAAAAVLFLTLESNENSSLFNSVRVNADNVVVLTDNVDEAGKVVVMMKDECTKNYSEIEFYVGGKSRGVVKTGMVLRGKRVAFVAITTATISSSFSSSKKKKKMKKGKKNEEGETEVVSCLKIHLWSENTYEMYLKDTEMLESWESSGKDIKALEESRG